MIKSAEADQELYQSAQERSEVLERQEEIMKGVGKIFGITLSDVKDFATNIESIFLNGWTVALAVVGFALNQIKKTFSMINDAVSSFQSGTGILGGQLDDVQGITADIGLDMAMLGGSTEAGAEAATSLYNSFQSTFMLTKKNVTAVAEWATKLGMTSDSGAELLRTMKFLGGLSTDQTKEFVEQTKQLSIQAGIAPKDALEEIANASGETLSYFRGNTKELQKAAVYAKKMNIEMSTLTEQADNLLDFETSIAAQMEASVLAGQHLNFDASRRLMFQGKFEEGNKAALDVIASISGFRDKDYITQRKIAAASGLSLDAIFKELEARERISNMTDAERDAAAERAKNAQTIQITWNKIRGILDNVLHKIFYPIAESITKWVEEGDNMEAKLNKIATAFKWIFGIMTSIAALKLFTGMAKGASTLLKDMKGLVSGTETIAKTKKPQRGLFEMIFGKNTKPSRIIAGAAAMVLMAGAFFIISKSLKPFQQLDWGALAKAGITMVGLMASMVGIGQLSKKFGKDLVIGSAAMALLGAALIPMGMGLQEFAKSAGSAGDIVKLTGALGILALGIVGLGMLVMGPQGVVALAGLGALLLLTGSLFAVGKMLNPVIPVFERFGNLDGGSLIQAAAGVGALGVALAAFGGGSAIAGVGNFIGKLFGGDMVTKFERFAKIGPGIKMTADGISNLTESLRGAQYSKQATEVERLADAYDNLADSISDANSAHRGGGIGGAVKNLLGLGNVNSIRNSKRGSDKSLGDLHTQLLAINRKLNNVNVNMDGKKVGQLMLAYDEK